MGLFDTPTLREKKILDWIYEIIEVQKLFADVELKFIQEIWMCKLKINSLSDKSFVIFFVIFCIFGMDEILAKMKDVALKNV